MKHPLIIAIAVIMTTPVMAKNKVYGSLHTSFQQLSHVDGMSSNTLILDDALFGIKGTKDLNKDVSMIYQMSWGLSETSFDGQRENSIENRNQAIGLASSLGAVMIGRFDTPFKTVGRKADLFWHAQLGQNRHITNAKNWDVRADKIIVFQSPKIKGMQASAAYAMDISDTSRLTENASATSLSLDYKKAHFTIGVGYENQALKTSSGNRDAFRFTTAYQKQNLRLQGFYQKENNAIAFTGDADVFGMGVAFTKGKGLIKAQYYLRDDMALKKNSELIALGYDYQLSPQLDVYLQAAKLTGNARFNGFESDVGQSVGPVNKAVSLGLRVRF